jgi:hypothetical protein
VSFAPGDFVVFRMTKVSTEPCHRAVRVHPSEHGETYTYLVDKFWVVAEQLPNSRVALLTRRGKRHEVSLDDPRLRPANWLERWLYRHRFPNLQQLQALQQTGRAIQKLRAAADDARSLPAIRPSTSQRS